MNIMENKKTQPQIKKELVELLLSARKGLITEALHEAYKQGNPIDRARIEQDCLDYFSSDELVEEVVRREDCADFAPYTDFSKADKSEKRDIISTTLGITTYYSVEEHIELIKKLYE